MSQYIATPADTAGPNVDATSSIITNGTQTQNRAEEEDLDGTAPLTAAFTKAWDAEAVAGKIDQAKWPMVKLQRAPPAALDETDTANAYKIAAVMAKHATLWMDPAADFPFFKNAILQKTKKSAELATWIGEYAIKCFDERRAQVIAEHGVRPPGTAGSLLLQSGKRDWDEMRGGRSRTAGGRSSQGRSKRTRVEEEEEEVDDGNQPTVYTSAMKDRILGSYKDGPLLRPDETKMPNGADDAAMADFVKELMTIKGVTRVNNIQRVRYMTSQGATAFYKWFCDIFGEDGRKRLRNLAREASEEHTSVEVAAMNLENYKVENGNFPGFDPAALATQGRFQTPQEFIDCADLWVEATKHELNRDTRSIASVYHAHVSMANFGQRVCEVKESLNVPNPPAHLDAFIKKLIADYKLERGVGMVTVFLQWLAKTIRWQKNMKALQQMIEAADLLHRFREAWGDGAFLFIGPHFVSRVKAVPKGCRGPMLALFDGFWYVKETCKLAWDKIGDPVIILGKFPGEQDLSGDGYNFLGEIAARDADGG